MSQSPNFNLFGYILNPDGRTARKAESLEDLVASMDDMRLNRHVIRKSYHRGTEVSTVFISTDMSFNFTNDPDYKPLIWETMIFGGRHDLYQRRYRSYDDAVRWHMIITKRVKHYRRCTSATR